MRELDTVNSDARMLAVVLIIAAMRISPARAFMDRSVDRPQWTAGRRVNVPSGPRS